MPENEYQEEVRLGAQGRMVIPAQLRQALDLKPGDALIARARDGCLIVEKAAATRQRLKSRYARVGRSLANELVAERREEARRESGQ